MSANPSLGPRRTGVRPAAARALPPGTGPSAAVASPSPMTTSARCASGARSPLAPTEPRLGTTGCTRAFRSAISASTVVARMPECPRARTLARSSVIARTHAWDSGGPTPAAWLRSRLICSASSASRSMRTSANDPKPVLTPYTASALTAFASTTARARSIRARAAALSATCGVPFATATMSSSDSEAPSIMSMCAILSSPQRRRDLAQSHGDLAQSHGDRRLRPAPRHRGTAAATGTAPVASRVSDGSVHVCSLRVSVTNLLCVSLWQILSVSLWQILGGEMLYDTTLR